MPESQLEQPRRRAVGTSPTLGVWFAVLAALGAGLGLRIYLLNQVFDVNGDSLVYGAIAKNLLLHGRYALTLANGDIHETLIRLPGYPLFLAVLFRLFGMKNYYAAACVQIGLDLAGCLLLAGFALRAARAIRPGNEPFARRAALITLGLAALCPFTAAYAALPLAEAPTLFSLALTMWAMARFREQPGWASALWFTLGVTWAALLRPDGALAAAVFVPVMLLGLRGMSRRATAGSPLRIALVCVLLAAAPFAAWTWRNWRVFHVFQPLAPRSAADPGEPTNPGWESWVKTWCLDFVSTYQVYWNVPGDKFDMNALPSRAFDSPQQYAATAALARAYNSQGMQLTPQLDAGFAALARERIAANPLRSHLWLPLGRLADMWLRPRVQILPIDLDWWNYRRHHTETVFSWAYAGLNLAYLLLAAVGLWLRPRYWQALLAYILLRSALLLTIQAPETRYTIECFPMLLALGGIAVAAGFRNSAPRPGACESGRPRESRPRAAASLSAHGIDPPDYRFT